MKKIAALTVCILFAAISFSQKTIHDNNTEVRNVQGFHGVHISHGIDLYITQGTDEGVAISAPDPRDRANIKTVVEGGVLKIYYDAGPGVHINWNWSNRHMKAYVTVKDISELQASGGSDIFTEGALQINSLSLHLSGGSDFSGQLNGTSLSTHQSGGSDVKVSGKVSSLSVDASGGSDFSGYELSADKCDVDLSGGSDAHITVNNELNIHASGGSDVSYKGNAVIKNNSTSGGSDVHKKS